MSKPIKPTIVTDAYTAIQIVKAAKMEDLELINRVQRGDHIYFDLVINQNNKKYSFSFLAIVDSSIKKPDDKYEKGKYKIRFPLDTKFETTVKRVDVTGKMVSSVEEINLGDFFSTYEELFVNFIKTKMKKDEKQINTFIVRTYKQSIINENGLPDDTYIPIEKPKVWVRLSPKTTKGKPVDHTTMGGKVIIRYSDKEETLQSIKFEDLRKKCPGLNNIMLNLKLDQVRFAKDGIVHINVLHDAWSTMVITPLKNENIERERENIAAYKQMIDAKMGNKIAASTGDSPGEEQDPLVKEMEERAKRDETNNPIPPESINDDDV